MKQAYIDDCPYYLDDFLTNMKVVKDRSDRTEEAYLLISEHFCDILMSNTMQFQPKRLSIK